MTKTLATLAVNDTVDYGSATTRVVDATDATVTIENPDAGRVFGNRNRAPITLTFKRTSKTFAARTHLPVA